MGGTGHMTNNGKQQEWMRWIREKGPRFLLFARLFWGHVSTFDNAKRNWSFINHVWGGFSQNGTE